MSVTTNQGPLRPLNKLDSRHSLYTDKSSDSEQNINDHPQGLKIGNEIKMKKLSQRHKLGEQLFPEINNNQQNVAKPQKKESKNIEGKKSKKNFNQSQIKNEEPLNYRYQKQNKNGKVIDFQPLRQAQITEVISQIRQHEYEETPKHSVYNYKRPPIKQEETTIFKEQSNSIQIENTHMMPNGYQSRNHSKDNEQRMLRSSQGGRWMKSQSLMGKKPQWTPEYVTRHYHKHGSIMQNLLRRFIKSLFIVQKQLQTAIYKISILDGLEITQDKIENELKKQINFKDINQQHPQANWNQEQFTQYYTHYQSVLVKKVQQYKDKLPIVLKKYKNCVYFGTMLNGKKQGHGVLHYFSGRFFEGEFKEDQKIFGIEVQQQEIYYGTFKKGIKHGEGIQKNSQCFKIGTYFMGEFCMPYKQDRNEDQQDQTNNSSKTNILHKKGFSINSNSLHVYEDNLIIQKTNKGDIFVGYLNENQDKQGQGLQLFMNGDIYLGRYEAGTPEGYGEYYWSNGAYYRGQFLSGMRHGTGKWHMIQGDSFEGEYMNDKKNGKGVYYWKNSSKYVGHFENDYRHGYGQMYWQDGRVYKGQWLNGIQKNTIIKLDHHVKSAQKKPLPSVNKASYRTIQDNNNHSPNKKKKIPLGKLKSIYNPSNN